jgi:hypothetical protein
MPFLTKGKTNWKYILIVVILAMIVGGGILGYLRNFQREIIFPTQFPEIKRPERIEIEKPKIEDEIANWKTYSGDGFIIKYPQDWKVVIEESINLTYLTPKEKRIPEDIWVYATVSKREDLQVQPFYNPINFFGKLQPSPEKIMIDGREFYRSEEKFEGIREIKYAIASEDSSKIGWITLSIRYGRQRMDYYLPDSEIMPELKIFEKMLSTFRFIELEKQVTIPTDKTEVERLGKYNITIFLFKNLKTCIVGDKCTSGNCKRLYKNGDTFMEFEDNANFKALKPSDPEVNNYQLKKCLETKLDENELNYLKGEITKFLTKVSIWSKGSINLSPNYVEVPSAEITMSRWGDGFWLAPEDIKSLVGQYVTKNTDFVIVTNDIYDERDGVHWGIGGCGGTFGADYGLGGAGYSWVPKTKPGFWFECAGEKTYIHEWLHQLDYALEYISGVEDIYKDNFPKSLCGNADPNPYKWFPSPDTAAKDPDFPACQNYYDNWSGYCDSIKPRDCDFEWFEHLLSVHYNPKTNLIGNHCRNGKKDFDETEIDIGGKCLK